MTVSEITSSGSNKYSQILENVEPKALELVSNSTKESILKQLREFLEEIVETE
ncbi:hypothetical protein Kpol_376p18 [Vanderwaltozyma polyspora DSM 70294]|uniref:Uncharacterized protein n=1 Tax=Vanderwaltozyma polyspora (strain ATCC 22028 / DSM 70294 / BCRC 21397 / CBS 2163 / NBRC 10782 / NRRL Y-8283 / UCD 57-17) TaxID=436907 RepID=A7TRW8_VANPO|nr:uncharacterized protein Kpol_376p18 [Vanderwaltozyma polyspora DSM 70294]EDO15005.1 hypothetical protein Kpol_376p18 [Vanderwaltozyma polyspora DSM 70294]